MSEQNQHAPSSRHSGAAHRRAHLWSEFRLAVAVLLVFTVLKLWFEHTSFGHWLHVQSHVWLQSHIQPADTNPPLAVVDITGMKAERFFVTNGVEVTAEFFTPRSELETLVAKIAGANPSAIGVDVDLSIETNLVLETRLEDASKRLKETALALSSNGVPVFLGVKRNEGLESKDWLAGAQYRPLAASLARPVGTVSHMPSEFEFPEHLVTLEGLAYALAGKVRAAQEPPRWLETFARRVSVETPVPDAPTFKMRKFPVDYSVLDALASKRIPFESVTNPATATNLSGIFGGKIVLIGDATPYAGADTANVPGRGEPVPGIYVHACAAYTLIRAPLWELKPGYGLLLAFLCSLVAVAFVYRVCHRFAANHRVTTVPLTIVLTVVLMAAFVCVALALARFLHVLWLEVLLVCVVLVAHCLFEILFGTVNWERFKHNPVESFVVAPDKE